MQPKSPPQRLIAYYKATLGTLLLLSGALGLTYSLWVRTQHSLVIGILGAALFLFGCFCLNRPYFLLEPRQLTVYTLLGTVNKRYTFESWDVVKADNRRIYIDNGGITIKVPVIPWLVKTDDWSTVRKLL